MIGLVPSFHLAQRLLDHRHHLGKVCGRDLVRGEREGERERERERKKEKKKKKKEWVRNIEEKKCA